MRDGDPQVQVFAAECLAFGSAVERHTLADRALQQLCNSANIDLHEHLATFMAERRELAETTVDRFLNHFRNESTEMHEVDAIKICWLIIRHQGLKPEKQSACLELLASSKLNIQLMVARHVLPRVKDNHIALPIVRYLLGSPNIELRTAAWQSVDSHPTCHLAVEQNICEAFKNSQSPHEELDQAIWVASQRVPRFVHHCNVPDTILSKTRELVGDVK